MKIPSTLQALEAFLPKGLKEVLVYVSPAALGVVEWKALITRARPMMKQLDWSDVGVIKLEALDQPQRKALGIQILSDYFENLWKEGEGSVLDFRLNRYQVDTGERFEHTQRGLKIGWDPKFIRPLRELYIGYYRAEKEALNRSIVALGFAGEGNVEAINEVRDLLEKHFGPGDQREVKFNLAEFRGSFHEIFIFLTRNKRKLSSDFVFLGFALLTLYAALDSLGQKLDVRSVFDSKVR